MSADISRRTGGAAREGPGSLYLSGGPSSLATVAVPRATWRRYDPDISSVVAQLKLYTPRVVRREYLFSRNGVLLHADWC